MSSVDETLRSAIVKCSTARLVLELKRAQNVLDEDQIVNLSRLEFISYVYHLRQAVGQYTPLQDVVPNFKIGEVKMFQGRDTDMEEAAATRAQPTPSKSLPSIPLDSNIAALLSSLANMQKEAAEERRLRSEEH